MSWESTFSYDGIPRLSYFLWVNPNHAAAALVTLLPFFWAFRHSLEPKGKGLLFWALIAGVEVCWSLLIGWTYSRGAMVAWAVALGVFASLQTSSRASDRSERRLFWGFTFGVFLAVLIGTGVGQRFVDIAEGDRSAVNRLGIWSNGLKLIAASPWTGWGKGNSGNALLHWFEPVESNREYAAIVNTYLHGGAEFGLPVLFLTLALLLSTLIVGSRLSQKPATGRSWKSSISLGATSGLIAFATAGFFSTLWVNLPTITVALFLAVLIWTLALFNKATPLQTIWTAGALAAILCGITYAGGAYAMARDACSVRKKGSLLLVTKNDAPASKEEIIVLPDRLVFGTFYGRPIRELLAKMPSWSSVLVCPKAPPACLQNLPVVVCGSRFKELLPQWKNTIAVLCPTRLPNAEETAPPLLAILPEYDEFGVLSHWQRSVSSESFHILTETGQDCSSKVEELARILSPEIK